MNNDKNEQEHKKKTIAQYQRGALKYVFNGNTFHHNFDKDFHIALVKESESAQFISKLKELSSVVTNYRVVWTAEALSKNAERLFLTSTVISNLATNAKNELALIAIIFQNTEANYSIEGSGNYQVQWQNKALPLLLEKGLLFSNNIENFFYFSTLIIGPAIIDDLSQFNGSKPLTTVTELISTRTNLVGSNTWESFTELFKVANLCADWLVLRNAEFLPNDFWGNDKDIDILCAELSPYLMAINAVSKNNSSANFQVSVEHKLIDVDARYVGDDYYDRIWQKEMLSTKNYQQGVPQLSIENYFYSLLYHARIHKNAVKKVYIERLENMAKSMNMPFDKQLLVNDSLCASFFDDYFYRRHYFITYPKDYACYENLNLKVVRASKRVKNVPFNFDFTVRMIKHKLFLFSCNLAPRWLKELLKRAIN